MTIRALSFCAVLTVLAGCGLIYTAPDVSDGKPLGSAYGTDYDVKVVPMTHESAAAANLLTYVPARLPLAFQPGAAAKGARASIGAPSLPNLPAATARPTSRPAFLADEFPSLTEPEPYRIGVSDELLLSVNGVATLENLPGLITAQSKRQGYMSQAGPGPADLR